MSALDVPEAPQPASRDEETALQVQSCPSSPKRSKDAPRPVRTNSDYILEVVRIRSTAGKTMPEETVGESELQQTVEDGSPKPAETPVANIVGEKHHHQTHKCDTKASSLSTVVEASVDPVPDASSYGHQQPQPRPHYYHQHAPPEAVHYGSPYPAPVYYPPQAGASTALMSVYDGPNSASSQYFQGQYTCPTANENHHHHGQSGLPSATINVPVTYASVQHSYVYAFPPSMPSAPQHSHHPAHVPGGLEALSPLEAHRSHPPTFGPQVTSPLDRYYYIPDPQHFPSRPPVQQQQVGKEDQWIVPTSQEEARSRRGSYPVYHPPVPGARGKFLPPRNPTLVNSQGPPSIAGRNASVPSFRPPVYTKEALQARSDLSSINTHAPSLTGSAQTITIRGPPRKPKRSGPCLWIGNVPKHTTVGELKDLFSSGLGDQIKSLYMIDKTHSAFVNYKTEGACLEALRKFQNLNFKGSRLVCRIKDSRSESEGTEHRNAGPSRSLASDGGVPEDRFFILKSLTVEDLSVSVGTGLWSTMPQNEPVLMDAFKNSKNVYLFFSANRSGEFFGYARMESEIFTVEKSASVNTTVGETAIPAAYPAQLYLPLQVQRLRIEDTPATANAPKGRIIDDSARGIVFWEASTPEVEPAEYFSDPGAQPPTSSAGGNPDGVFSRTTSDSSTATTATAATTATTASSDSAGSKTVEESTPLSSLATSPSNLIVTDNKAAECKKQFRVRWISTVRVPFHKTTGLRNNLNFGREVKVARDGTEVEEAVGRKLIGLFTAI